MRYPDIEKGVEMPVKVIDGRYGPKPKTHRYFHETWATVLRRMEIGDSIWVNRIQANSVRTIARTLNLDLVWKYYDNGTRIWLYDKPGLEKKEDI